MLLKSIFGVLLAIQLLSTATSKTVRNTAIKNEDQQEAEEDNAKFDSADETISGGPVLLGLTQVGSGRDLSALLNTQATSKPSSNHHDHHYYHYVETPHRPHDRPPSSSHPSYGYGDNYNSRPPPVYYAPAPGSVAYPYAPPPPAFYPGTGSPFFPTPGTPFPATPFLPTPGTPFPATPFIPGSNFGPFYSPFFPFQSPFLVPNPFFSNATNFFG